MPSHAYLEHTGVLAFAHRGDGEAAPENTHAAFASAVAMGYRYLETDVHLSRDGALLAFHDDRLDRVTDQRGKVAELDLAALRRARVGGREPIPLMAELFEAFPDCRFNIEPKSDAAVGPLIALLRQCRATDRVCVGSFSGARIERVRAALPGLCTSMGPLETSWARFGSLGLPVPALRAACAQVPVRYYGIRVVDRRFCDHLRRLGLQTHVWTVNEDAEMARLLDIGVDGLMTDRPAALKRLLLARGEWVD